MDIKLVFAIITITLALVFYTIGVFGERKAGTLQKKHLVTFWCGLAFDITGTTIMSFIASAKTVQLSTTASLLHGVTGVAAIALMLFHAIWATCVLLRGNERQRASFHKFSIVVWAVWLVPYVLGMIVGMSV
ncbi:MAG: HsmA family protein [Christensenella hongkongensis]|uniref:HsmA family protein n=1 Tax=Christensenella hongkongensis TaxID=270498 RepID=UPI002671C12E|nr:HsmA family protein [Christensenella hongkongensis]MDY3002866.1 HsmA family protein [Christensenella hongkongensis]